MHSFFLNIQLKELAYILGQENGPKPYNVKTKCDGISISNAVVKWLLDFFSFFLFFKFQISNQPDEINLSISFTRIQTVSCYIFMSCNNCFMHVHFLLFSVLKRTTFFTPNRHGYSVQFSPFDAHLLAVGKSTKCAFTFACIHYYIQ